MFSAMWACGLKITTFKSPISSQAGWPRKCGVPPRRLADGCRWMLGGLGQPCGHRSRTTLQRNSG
jgi:hypothetical protein